MKRLIDLHGEPKGWEQKIGIYYEALRDLPDWLLDIAVKHAICTNAFFPKPAELRASVADELADDRRRRDEAALAALAALPKPPEREPPTQQDRDYVAQLVKKAAAALKRMEERDNAA